jgi:hypothetical protein
VTARALPAPVKATLRHHWPKSTKRPKHYRGELPARNRCDDHAVPLHELMNGDDR